MTKTFTGKRIVIKAETSLKNGELMETGEITVKSENIIIISPVCGNCGSGHVHMHCHGCDFTVCAHCWDDKHGLCGECVNPAR